MAVAERVEGKVDDEIQEAGRSLPASVRTGGF